MPNGWEWLIIAAVFMLLFGAKKLPEMARSIGQSARVFKGEMKGMQADDEARSKSAENPPAPQQALPASSAQPAASAQPQPHAQPVEGSSSSDNPR